MLVNEFFLPVNIGDTTTLIEGTNTLKSGDTVEIIGFIDDNKDKVIVEGIAPGGWIPSRKLRKGIARTRHMNILEMLVNGKYARPDIIKLAKECKSYIVGPAGKEEFTKEITRGDIYARYGLEVGTHDRPAISVVSKNGTCYVYLEYLVPYDTPPMPIDDYSLRMSHPGSLSVFLDGVKESVRSEIIPKLTQWVKDFRIQGKDMFTGIFNAAIGRSVPVTVSYEVGESTVIVGAGLNLAHLSLYKGENVLGYGGADHIYFNVIDTVPSKKAK